jgi:hypothetical protein
VTNVTQEDREAAAKTVSRMGNPKFHADDIREGLCDDIPVVQAFARHREQARADALKEAAKVADRIAVQRRHAQRGNIGNRTCADEAEGASAVAIAIRALKTTPAPAVSTDDGWQPIATFTEPTALSSGNGVLVAEADGTVGEAYYRNFGDDSDGWWWINTSWGDFPEPSRPRPTHWRALPAPPDAGQVGDGAAGMDVASIWRNAITNTILLIDVARKRHPVASRNRAYAAFDRELNDLVEKWFSFSRGVSPKTYSEAEAEWQRFDATAIRSLSAAQEG